MTQSELTLARVTCVLVGHDTGGATLTSRLQCQRCDDWLVQTPRGEWECEDAEDGGDA
jgi:hypothetical protein